MLMDAIMANALGGGGGAVLDLDEYGLGEVIGSLIAEGGGMRVWHLDADGSTFAKIAKINPNYITLIYDGIPATCTISTKFVVDIYEVAFFGFNAFLPQDNGGIVELIVTVRFWIGTDDDSKKTMYEVTVQV